jgi:hypothetical protein
VSFVPAYSYEATPGASLSKEGAVARAEKFLREEEVRSEKWTLVESIQTNGRIAWTTR